MTTRSDAQLMIDYADLGVTTGYIGNIERWGDQRSFRVFTMLSTRPGADCCDTSINIFDVPRDTKGTWSGEIVYDTPEVRAKLDAFRERLAQGKLHRVGEKRWLKPGLADAAEGKVPTYWKYGF